MKQRTHTWLAIRAVALLEDTKTAPGLVKILKPHVKSTAIGAWIPDLRDSRKGVGDIDNHIMKMKRYTGSQKQRFILAKKDLLKRLGPKRLMHEFITKDTTLGNAWWQKPYKADPQPGQHLANRSMALSTTLVDLLILGDPSVAELVPGKVSFAGQLDPDARPRKEQVSTYFFMLSHFVADACMPCHCDARSLSGYSKGLHKELEAHWSKVIGTFFEKKKLLETPATSRRILANAREVDKKFGIGFPNKIPDLKAKDAWKEILFVCRASFALACVMAPPKKYPLGSKKQAPFKTLFGNAKGKLFLKELDKVIMQDAILNIAMVWRDIWKTF